MQFLRRSLTGLFLLSLTLGLLVYAGSVFVSAVQDRMNRKLAIQPAEERVFAVNTVGVAARDVVPVITAFGSIESRRTMEMRASAEGRIVELAENFETGAAVGTGALLARIDPRAAESALEVARTDLAEAKVELRDAERNLTLVHDELAASQAQAALRSQALKRQQDLARRGVGTDAAVETAALDEASANQSVVSRRMAEASAENRLDLARTSLSRARIALADAERDLADTEIRAAFSGTLSDVTVVEGGLVSQNERLATLIDPGSLEVAFQLSTARYARLLTYEGDLIDAPVRVKLDVLGLDLIATGRVARVNAAVGEGQTGRQIFARLDHIGGFRPGDFVTVEIEEPQLAGVAVLPATAVDAAGTVLAVLPDRRLEILPVDLLRRQGDEVIVAAAAVDGRRIVAERSPLLGGGVLVRETGEQTGTPDRQDGGGASADLIALTPERRAALIAAVEANAQLPVEARERILSQLRQEQVPASMVARIESRMGG
ncbi:efflux RND transporter periplasmic adaptor subunit [Tropicimonas sp.]|uniref:efflux RND transporter periplasmic adaptor subunit n=1 Tax=Tropicimonas sp. TaxID=2067044 RepID=UPI003A88E535